MVLLDTDLLSLLERDNAGSLPLQMRLDQIPAHDIATAIITYEEQMRGWLARAAQANTTEKMLIAYARLQTHIETFKGVPVLPFDAKAAVEFERLRQAHVRIGTMDLKIAGHRPRQRRDPPHPQPCRLQQSPRPQSRRLVCLTPRPRADVSSRARLPSQHPAKCGVYRRQERHRLLHRCQHFSVVCDVLFRQVAARPVIQPFVCRLIAANAKLPGFRRHVVEVFCYVQADAPRLTVRGRREIAFSGVALLHEMIAADRKGD